MFDIRTSYIKLFRIFLYIFCNLFLVPTLGKYSICFLIFYSFLFSHLYNNSRRPILKYESVHLLVHDRSFFTTHKYSSYKLSLYQRKHHALYNVLQVNKISTYLIFLIIFSSSASTTDTFCGHPWFLSASTRHLLTLHCRLHLPLLLLINLTRDLLLQLQRRHGRFYMAPHVICPTFTSQSASLVF